MRAGLRRKSLSPPARQTLDQKAPPVLGRARRNVSNQKNSTGPYSFREAPRASVPDWDGIDLMPRRLGQILVDMGYLDEEKLWAVLEEQKRSGSELIGRVAVRMELVKEEHVLKALGEQLGMKVIKLSETTIPSELTELVNETMATAFKVVPVSQNKKDKSVTVALAEPQNPATIDSLHSFLQVEVKGVIASESEVLAAIERLYAGHSESIEDVVKQIETDKGLSQFSHRNENTIDLEAIEEMA